MQKKSRPRISSREPVAIYCIKVTEGSDDSTELSTTQATTITTAPEDVADQLRAATVPAPDLQSLSKVYSTTDYATTPAMARHLGEVLSMLVHNKVRDFSGDVYEIFHCLVEDVEKVTQDCSVKL